MIYAEDADRINLRGEIAKGREELEAVNAAAAMMRKFPNRPSVVYQKHPERPFDPEPTLNYETRKQVDW